MARRPPPTVAVCLVGLSPAVVTETLYALAVGGRPRVVPDELHIITTLAGLARVTGSLLGPGGALARLRADYRLPAQAFRCSTESVHVLTGASGEPLDDIVSRDDSEAIGDQIAGILRSLIARRPAARLHCSLAGGRKTMSALLAVALQLHGRPGDRLSHVLVSPPFESAADFFYPPPVKRVVEVGGRRLDARRARVTLADIPVVKLGAVVRELGLTGLGLGRLAAEMEMQASGRLRAEPLVVDLARQIVCMGAEEIGLPPQQLALYAVYAAARRRCRSAGCAAGGRCAGCHLSDAEMHDRRDVIVARCREFGSDVRRLEARWAGESGTALEAFRAWIEQTRSRLNRALGQRLGTGPHGRMYQILAPGAPGGARRRGIGVPPARIRVVERQA